MSVVGNESGHGRPASGRRFERSQGWRSEIKRAAASGVSRRLGSGVAMSPNQQVARENGMSRSACTGRLSPADHSMNLNVNRW